MKYAFIHIRYLLLFSIWLTSCTSDSLQKSTTTYNGVNLVMPAYPQFSTDYEGLSSLHINAAAIVPFGFMRKDSATVYFNLQNQWWGERAPGVVSTIKTLDSIGIASFLKPHLWVSGVGWPGEIDFTTKNEWAKWESDYADYILFYANLAEAHKVALFSIGNELSPSALERTDFWYALINQVREIYNGEIIYCANWDNYMLVNFWDKLDYIGVNAYFPFKNNQNDESLHKAWLKKVEILHKFSKKYGKRILFSEFGYLAFQNSVSGHWKVEKNRKTYSEETQEKALKALFHAVWDEPWFKGGFLWKWYPKGFMPDSARLSKSFTVQGKKAESLVREYYKKNNK